MTDGMSPTPVLAPIPMTTHIFIANLGEGHGARRVHRALVRLERVFRGVSRAGPIFAVGQRLEVQHVLLLFLQYLHTAPP
jgi:hypothetical protein